MVDSIGTETSVKPEKPAKPYPEFPLYSHASKRWAKKIRGKTHFFGHWDDWKAALERYQYEVHWLQRGETPPPRDVQALTVDELVDHFLEHREAKVASGELAQRTWDDYLRTGRMLRAELGKYKTVESLTATDFSKLREKLSQTLGLVALGNEIGRARVILNFAYKHDLIDKPVRFGLGFDKPTRKSLKKAKQAKPAKIFTVAELRTLYHAADPQMKAFMLLALNGGMGNADIGQLEPRHIQGGWVRFPRPKTLVDRTFPLWKETAKAVEKARQTKYPELPTVFATRYGLPWHRDDNSSPLSVEFKKLCVECKLHRQGRGFYALRHQFRTVADGCRDTPAVDCIMGHTDSSMGGNYREWIEPERLQAVVDHVKEWLKPMFRKPSKRKGGAK